jgi:hypothetical protein
MTARRKRLKAGILFGGRSAEHEVSVVSAQGVMGAIDTGRFQPVPIGVSRQGTWLTPAQTERALDRIRSERLKSLDEPLGEGILYRVQALASLRRFDVVFPLIHGTNGEDGTLQGLRSWLYPMSARRCRQRARDGQGPAEDVLPHHNFPIVDDAAPGFPVAQRPRAWPRAPRRSLVTPPS